MSIWIFLVSHRRVSSLSVNVFHNVTLTYLLYLKDYVFSDSWNCYLFKTILFCHQKFTSLHAVLFTSIKIELWQRIRSYVLERHVGLLKISWSRRCLSMTSRGTRHMYHKAITNICEIFEIRKMKKESYLHFDHFRYRIREFQKLSMAYPF